MPAGRPAEYDPSFCDAVIEIGREGGGKAEMASQCGVSRQAFWEWQQRYPEFGDAVTRAVDLSAGWWEAQGRKGVWAGPQFNANAYSLQVRNRFPADWRDKQEQAHVGADGGPIEFADVSDRDRAKALALLARKAGAQDAE